MFAVYVCRYLHFKLRTTSQVDTDLLQLVLHWMTAQRYIFEFPVNSKNNYERANFESEGILALLNVQILAIDPLKPL